MQRRERTRCADFVAEVFPGRGEAAQALRMRLYAASERRLMSLTQLD
jgi:hypothetical protein